MPRFPELPSNAEPTELIAAAERALRRSHGPYRDDPALLAEAELLFRVRLAAGSATEAATARRLRGLARKLRTLLHRSTKASAELHLGAAFRRGRLTQLEREIVLVLCLHALGLVEQRFPTRLDVADLQSALGLQGREAMRVPAALSGGSRLVGAGLVHVLAGEVPVEDEVRVDPRLLEPLVEAGGRRGASSAWRVGTHEELLDSCQRLVTALAERGELIAQCQHGVGSEADLPRRNRAVDREMRGLEQALQDNPAWPLARLRGTRLGLAELQVLLVLLGKELGFRRDPELLSGGGLARCVSRRVADYRHALRFLRGRSPLRVHGLVRPSGGSGGELAAEDDAALQETGFELTPQALEQLGVRPRRQPCKGIRQPVVRMDSLVLAPQVREALDLLVAQAKHRDVLFDEWGLGETIAYGRGQTALFAGPPGVGKTATAEALASELGQALYVARPSGVQSMWVGETEKAIVKAFREAAEWEAVMFWDEADALFVNRDQADRSFEVRWVNVLLQEIERYEGVCVLATNRRWSLDPALERRITVKVDFPAPDAAACRAILRKLLPPGLPLAKDVDLDALAVAGLSGGQLKNVVLNAARRAVTRGRRARLTMADLRSALEGERPARERARIGIGAGGR